MGRASSRWEEKNEPRQVPRIGPPRFFLWNRDSRGLNREGRPLVQNPPLVKLLRGPSGLCAS